MKKSKGLWRGRENRGNQKEYASEYKEGRNDEIKDIRGETGNRTITGYWREHFNVGTAKLWCKVLSPPLSDLGKSAVNIKASANSDNKTISYTFENCTFPFTNLPFSFSECSWY